MIRTQIQLEEADFARLKKEAARRSCSVSAFVRDSVKAALHESDHAAGLSAVREIAGKYHSGKGDLSRNHDTYLENGW
jgi:predicted DNA-binding ribbon-helix-helix protein